MKIRTSAKRKTIARTQPRSGQWKGRIKSRNRSTCSPYQIYINSLSASGRKGMVCMLATACRLLGWTSAPRSFPWHQLRFQDLQIVRSKMLDKQYAINSINMTLSGLRSVARTAFVSAGEKLYH